jgi:broad specificity phosphatase PhoE
VTTFLFVRHAAHDWLGRGLAGRLGGVSLNPQGWLQAEALVRRLEPWPLHAIYSSPQPRCTQTVAAAGGPAAPEGAGRAGVRRDRLRRLDRPHLRQPAPRPGLDRLEHPPRHRLPAGRRAVRAGAAPRHGRPGAAGAASIPDRTVLVASHADVIKAVIASVLQMSLDHLERFDIAPASVSVIDAGEGWQRVQLVNDLN